MKFSNERAMMAGREVIVLTIAVFIISGLIGPAISAINGANTTGWTTTQLAIWGVVGVVILAVVVMKIAE